MKIIFVFIWLTMFNTMLSQPNRYTILDTTLAEQTMNQCSRWTPTIQGSWVPTDKDIQSLEDSLESISRLISEECCFPGTNKEQPRNSLRQYIGIVIDGEKYIYVNAFPLTEFDDYPPEAKRPDWHKEAIRVCDGGGYYWGVLYNPMSKIFSHLAFNGVG